LTDGLVEHPGQGLVTGLDALATTAATVLTARPDGLSRLHASVARPDHRDDVCALHISLPPTSSQE
jgi:hypothetical protein